MNGSLVVPTATAAWISCATPALRQLERTVGAPLLERSSRGVTLTAVGDVLLRETASVLAGAERAMNTARRAAAR